MTPLVLRVLREEGVKATFFVIGALVEKRPDLLRAVAAEGHEIGNHTYNHSSLVIQRRDRVREEISKCADAVWNAAGIKPRMFRAPYGHWNRTVAMEAIAQGYTPMHWTRSSRDWRLKSASAVWHRSAISVGSGTILLFHDGFGKNKAGDRNSLVRALPGIIRSLRQEGFEFVRVSEMLHSVGKESLGHWEAETLKRVQSAAG